MKVEIWSDIVCPFCYIGKRKFEQALAAFGVKEQVSVQWRSFQLDPDARSEHGKSLQQSLSEKKGWSLEQTAAIMAQVTAMAKEVGLDYRMDKAVVANTVHAHRLAHLAASYGLQDAAEERLFKAYFIEGTDIGSLEVLEQLGLEVGLPAEAIRQTLHSDQFSGAVVHDQHAAQQAGVRGVPFFVFNGTYAVSGAQPPEVFVQVMERLHQEKERTLEATGGFCTPEGACS